MNLGVQNSRVLHIVSGKTGTVLGSGDIQWDNNIISIEPGTLQESGMKVTDWETGPLFTGDFPKTHCPYVVGSRVVMGRNERALLDGGAKTGVVSMVTDTGIGIAWDDALEPLARGRTCSFEELYLETKYKTVLKELKEIEARKHRIFLAREQRRKKREERLAEEERVEAEAAAKALKLAKVKEARAAKKAEAEAMRQAKIALEKKKKAAKRRKELAPLKREEALKQSLKAMEICCPQCMEDREITVSTWQCVRRNRKGQTFMLNGKFGRNNACRCLVCSYQAKLEDFTR